VRDYDKVEAGERVKAFLADEYVKLALSAMEQDALRQFKIAKNDEELRKAQALSVVTDTFAYRLLGMVEEGQLARNAEEG
jgi:hypothetical protein